jgi:hypothetical protein
MNTWTGAKGLYDTLFHFVQKGVQIRNWVGIGWMDGGGA